jgi:hypothetical protein
MVHVPSGDLLMFTTTQLLKHLEGKHDQSTHAHGGSHASPTKPRQSRTAATNRAATESEAKAILDYTTNGAAQINAKLRKIDSGVRAADRMSDSERDAMQKGLDSYLEEQSLSEPLQLFRYTTTDAFGGEEKLAKLAGKTIKDRGYLSTTSLKSDTKFGGDVTIKITAPKGSKAAPIGDYSAYKNEKEVLFARNTQMEVKSVRFSNRSLEWTVEVEVLPSV